MQMTTKATSTGVGYASKSDYEYEGKNYEADLQHGDIVTILDGGSVEESQFGPQHYFLIKTRNGEKRTPFNQSSINILVAAYGAESEQWIGKEAKILTKKTVIAGKKVIVAYFVVKGWYLDDFGDLTIDTPVQPETILTPKTDAQKEVEAIRNTPSGDGIKEEGIPF